MLWIQEVIFLICKKKKKIVTQVCKSQDVIVFTVSNLIKIGSRTIQHDRDIVCDWKRNPTDFWSRGDNS